MSVDLTNLADPVEAADAQAVMEHLLQRKAIPADVRDRIRRRAAEATDRIRQEQGTVNIAVTLIRDTRDQ